MTKNYTYPLDYSWSHQEMTIVIQLFNAVECAYESSIKSSEFLKAYKQFKQVVPSKSEEKQLAKAFEKLSGYSLYKVYQFAIQDNTTIIKMR